MKNKKVREKKRNKVMKEVKGECERERRSLRILRIDKEPEEESF